MSQRTRASLYYVAAYLTLTGIGLAVAPQLVLRILLSNGQYDDVFVRFSGILMVGLGIGVIQLVRHHAAALYPSTLFIRAVIWAAVAGLYFTTRDPFFLVVLAVVGAGMIWTGACYYLDHRSHSSNPAE
ncbi:MAG: hypothetical protein HY316_06855 [Acidobacteria bacterium]|nr:hypothetical protein [Acidobacteriota bacterium]